MCTFTGFLLQGRLLDILSKFSDMTYFGLGLYRSTREEDNAHDFPHLQCELWHPISGRLPRFAGLLKGQVICRYSRQMDPLLACQMSAFGFNPYRDNYRDSYRESYPFSLAHFPSISPMSPFPDIAFPLTDYRPQSNTMSHQEQSQQSMQGQGSPHIPIDPSLNHLQYPSYYGGYPGQSQPQHHHQPQPSHHFPQHLSLPPNYSSPSSGASDTIGTPPVDHAYPPSSSSGLNSKRPASSISNATASTSRKKVRRDEEDADAQSPAADKDEKPKPTRGSRLVIRSCFEKHVITVSILGPVRCVDG